MNISTIFFVFVGITLLGLAIVFLNFFRFLKKDDMLLETQGFFGAHFIAMFLYISGGLGAVISGIIWALQYLKS